MIWKSVRAVISLQNTQQRAYQFIDKTKKCIQEQIYNEKKWLAKHHDQ